MRTWEPTLQVEVGLDLCGKERKVGDAAATGRFVFFEYDDAFLAEGIDPSPIRLKRQKGLQQGSDQLEGLPGLLDDSLPDGWSKLVLDRFVRSQGYNPGILRPLDRVALVGKTGPGAITYQSPIELPFEAPDVDFDTAADLVSNADTDEDLGRLNAAMSLAGSLGGARPKAQVWLNNGEITTRSISGARQWIVKFPAKSDHSESGAVEYAYSLMAAAAGIVIPRTRLLPSGHGPGYFAVERFDRTETGARLHVHSLGGLLHASCRVPSLGYEELFKVTGYLAGPAALEQQVRRMAFNVYARNRDDHAKNHAFLMDNAGAWTPSPAFDITYWDIGEHQLIVGSEGAAPVLDNMLEVTRAVEIDDAHATKIIEEVEAVVREWPSFASQASMSKARTKDIETAIQAGLPTPNAVAMAWHQSRGKSR